jgi:hypothetical protein
VEAGEAVHACVGHNNVDVLVDFGLADDVMRSVADAKWLQELRALEELTEKMMSSLASTPSEHYRAADAALTIASQAALFGADPLDAEKFAMMLCS